MLGRVFSSPRRSCALPLLVVVMAAAAGCSPTDSSTSVAVPTPKGEAARLCRALHKELPDVVDGLERRTADPVSDFTAVWGEPAVQLRCGVSEPDVLTPGSEHYNPAQDAAEINGVEWLFEQRDEGEGYRFTTVLRRAYVEVTVPGEYAPEVDVLVDLAGAVKKTIPVGVV